ncbi:putative GTP-binding protein (hflX) [Agrobacterium tumefaciens]|nr:putative GTP-binding protein (hflX) [Agrobacterium tumefaciens]
MRSAAIFFLDKAEPISTRDTSNESIIPEQEKRRDDMRAVVLVPVLKQQRENRDAAAGPSLPAAPLKPSLRKPRVWRSPSIWR